MKNIFKFNCEQISRGTNFLRRLPMNKNELVTSMAKEAGFTKAAAEKALEALMASVTKALKKGDDVRLVGFGTFSVTKRAATTGRNPRTGAAIKIKARLSSFQV